MRRPAPLAQTLSPLASAVLLLACGTALAQGTPADTAAPKALGEVTIKAAPQDDNYTPTATSTATAAAAIAAAHRRGLEVPRDLTVVGFDDTPVASEIWPALTTIRQPVSEMAQLAVQLLARGNNGGEPESDEEPPERLIAHTLDWRDAALIGRLETADGPSPILVRQGRVLDISRTTPTVAQALARPDCASLTGEDLGDLEAMDFACAWETTDQPQLKLLSPIDLQCIKASGVTFAVSAMERVIEERARGDAGAAQAIRESLSARIGGDLSKVKPGSEQAALLKTALIADGLWSQYLEVAIGPDAEIFTKAPVLSSVGWGAAVGVRSDSAWNNPEPEVVLVCDPSGKPVGASLGNDVNLRDIEGRSALLLGKAKDNNASAAIGPFIRLFDTGFSMDDVRQAAVSLQVTGEDGFEMAGRSTMSMISRDPEELVRQTCG
eukprot:gene17699-17535_t